MHCRVCNELTSMVPGYFWCQHCGTLHTREATYVPKSINETTNRDFEFMRIKYLMNKYKSRTKVHKILGISYRNLYDKLKKITLGSL